MEKILIINASARTHGSKSRKLTEVFVEHWLANHDSPTIDYRELGTVNVPQINEDWIAATLKPKTLRDAAENKVLTASETYIAELRKADIIVLGTPMYNWSIPSSLKAYIDQVFRVNETFRVNPGNAAHPYTGLLENKTLILLLSRGGQGYEEGEVNAHLNFQSTYLKTVFKIMGINDIYMIAINGTSLDKEALTINTDMAHQKVCDLVTLKPGCHEK